jgi:hypothetical protein
MDLSDVLIAIGFALMVAGAIWAHPGAGLAVLGGGLFLIGYRRA